MPHTYVEIRTDNSRLYKPRTYSGIYTNRHKLRRGELIIPREDRLGQKYLAELAALRAEEESSPDGLNRFTRRMLQLLEKNPLIIERNPFPYRVNQKECLPFVLWYRPDTTVYDRAMHVAAAIYTDGLDVPDAAIWINPPKHRSVPAIGHAQLIVKRYPENTWTLFQHLPTEYLHPDIYDIMAYNRAAGLVT